MIVHPIRIGLTTIEECAGGTTISELVNNDGGEDGGTYYHSGVIAFKIA